MSVRRCTEPQMHVQVGNTVLALALAPMWHTTRGGDVIAIQPIKQGMNSDACTCKCKAWSLTCFTWGTLMGCCSFCTNGGSLALGSSLPGGSLLSLLGPWAPTFQGDDVEAIQVLRQRVRRGATVNTGVARVSEEDCIRPTLYEAQGLLQVRPQRGTDVLFPAILEITCFG